MRLSESDYSERPSDSQIWAYVLPLGLKRGFKVNEVWSYNTISGTSLLCFLTRTCFVPWLIIISELEIEKIPTSIHFITAEFNTNHLMGLVHFKFCLISWKVRAQKIDLRSVIEQLSKIISLSNCHYFLRTYPRRVMAKLAWASCITRFVIFNLIHLFQFFNDKISCKIIFNMAILTSSYNSRPS